MTFYIKKGSMLPIIMMELIDDGRHTYNKFNDAIQNADIILVMKDGKIIEQGNHNELLSKKLLKVPSERNINKKMNSDKALLCLKEDILLSNKYLANNEDNYKYTTSSNGLYTFNYNGSTCNAYLPSNTVVITSKTKNEETNKLYYKIGGSSNLEDYLELECLK